jgi:hypothetical protein
MQRRQKQAYTSNTSACACLLHWLVSHACWHQHLQPYDVQRQQQQAHISNTSARACLLHWLMSCEFFREKTAFCTSTCNKPPLHPLALNRPTQHYLLQSSQRQQLRTHLLSRAAPPYW